jgi:hypothetical protein
MHSLAVRLNVFSRAWAGGHALRTRPVKIHALIRHVGRASPRARGSLGRFAYKKRVGILKNPPPFFSLPSPPFFISFSFSFFFFLFFSFSKSEFFFWPKHGYKNTADKASPTARGPLGRFASKKRVGMLKIPVYFYKVSYLLLFPADSEDPYAQIKSSIFGQPELFDPKLTWHFLQYARRARTRISSSSHAFIMFS